MPPGNIQNILTRYLNQQATPEESTELAIWVKNTEDNEALQQLLEQCWNQFEGRDQMRPGKDDLILNQLFNRVSAKPTHRIHFLKTTWLRYAAAIILILGTATWLWISGERSRTMSAQQGAERSRSAAIQPGSNKAILTIGNNKPIDLASNKSGIAVNNSITYTDGQNIVSTSAVIPTGNLLQLTTPKGGQYQAVLPDGTKVWLNAASSIKFPSKFEGKERRIEVTGEAYLEISAQRKQLPLDKEGRRAATGGLAARQPFIVTANGTEIQVLGTSFNINAYKDETTLKTTLIEGSVKIKTEEKETLLQPGQQATVTGKAINITSNTDVEQILAWKNGLFNFKGADLPTVMRQLERWYNIEVKYEGPAPKIEFKGKMYRNVSLSTVLRFLTNMNVKYQLEGKQLIIKNNI